MCLDSLYHLTEAQNVFLQRDYVSSAPFPSHLCTSTNSAGYSKDIDMKMMTTDFFIIRTGHDWSKSRILQRLCARPPWQEQVAEDSTIWHKCFECDSNEHNRCTTTWYPYTLWGPLFQWMLHQDINQHRGMFLLVLINEIYHFCVTHVVLYLLKTSYRCCPL